MTRTYTLLDIWQQVIEDNVSVDMSYGNKQAYIYKGIKVVKMRDEIKILNTITFGLEYEEIEEHLYDSFLSN